MKASEVSGVMQSAAAAAEISDDGVLPSVEQATKKALRAVPAPARAFIRNALAVISWIGLPATLLSTLSGLQWMIDVVAWLYRHAGVLQPVFDALGQAIVAGVAIWRGMVHPIWTSLASWFGLALPSWAPDILMLLMLCGVGFLRRTLKAAWDGHILSGGFMRRAIDRTRAPDADYIRMPRNFPFAQHFADNGVRMTPRRLREAQRLWRKWRAEQIRMFLIMDGSHWPLVREEVTRAQFGRFWLAVMDGRRAMLIYLIAAAGMSAAYLIDWSYRLASAG